jgi:hypothetical protein
MAEMFGLSSPVPSTIRISPRKNVAFPAVPGPANPERPMERCPPVMSTAPMKMARCSPSSRSAIHPPGREARYTEAP